MAPARQLTWRFPVAVSRRFPVAVALVVAVVCLFSLASVAAASTVESPGLGSASAAEIIPDMSLVVAGIDDEARSGVIERLGEIDGVIGVTTGTVTGRPEPATVFYLALREVDRVTVSGTSDRASEAVRDHRRILTDAEAVIAGATNGAVLVGGPIVVDQMLAERYARSVVWLVLLAAVLGLSLGAAFGWRRGLAAGAALGLAVGAAGALSNQISGGFDGTVASTALPGALAGVVVGVAITIRLMIWFRDPPGVDGAEQLRLSLLDMAVELGLIMAGLVVSAAVVGFLDPGPSPLTSIVIGVLIAAVVTAAVLGPALTFLAGTPEARPALFPLSVPDGRDLPLLVLSGVGFLLLVLAAFGFGQPATELVDIGDLPSDSQPVVVAEQLRTSGGDATSAVVAVASPGATQVDLDEWSRVAAEQPAVEWVDVGSVRYSSVGVVETDPSDLLTASSDGYAVVVLGVPPRADSGRTAIAELAGLPMVGGPPELRGPAVDAAGLAGARSTVIAAVLVLAVTGALSVRVLTQSTTQSAVSLLLRIVGGFATLGVFGLVVPAATSPVLISGIGLVWLGVSLFELDFLRVLRDTGTQTHDLGQAGAFGLLGLGLGGLVLLATAFMGGGPGTAGLGLGLAIGAAIELSVGALLLRPALLGQRAAFHAAARPVRVVLHSGLDREPSGPGFEDPEWRRIVSDLLQAEFHFQAEPARAVLSSAFVPDTPLYRQAASHHANLAEAGLQIVGRSPRLRSVKTVSSRAPISLAVTVDHPVRHLLNAEGVVVGVRKAERRSGVLWLSLADDGSYRIAESVELGSVPLPDVEPDRSEQQRFEIEIGLGDLEDAEPDNGYNRGGSNADERLDSAQAERSTIDRSGP